MTVSVAIILAVHLRMLSLQGIERAMFRPMAPAVMLLLPALCSNTARPWTVFGAAATPTDPMGVESTDSFAIPTPPGQWRGRTQDDIAC